MAKHLQLKHPVNERPRESWQTIAVELAGSQTRFVQGERWTHRIIEKGDLEAPPLFMYHGIGGYGEAYARTLPELSRDFRVIAVDALYHGFSSKEPWYDTDDRIGNQAAAYVDLLHALGYEKAIYEGESMGAMIGFEIGMRYPESVSKLILNGMGVIDTKRKDWKEQPYKGDLFDLSRKAVTDPTWENIANRLHWLVHDNDSINDEMIALRQRLYKDPAINASMRRVFGVEGGSLTEHLRRYTEEEVKAKWKTDTLVLYGEFNPMLGPDYGEYCADLIGGTFYEFKGVGHWPMWECPDEYIEVIRSYLL